MKIEFKCEYMQHAKQKNTYTANNSLLRINKMNKINNIDEGATAPFKPPSIDRSATYYKIIGNNNGTFAYKMGLNDLIDNNETFNRKSMCGPGGLYFSNIEHILEYLNYGNKLCILTIPNDAEVIKVKNKYKSDKIYINKIMEIDYSTIKYLIKCGADMAVGDNYAISWAARKGNLEIVRCLTEHGADVMVGNNYPVRRASGNGHLKVVKYLVEHGADVTSNDNSAIVRASYNGHLEVLKYLVEHGADITARNNCAIQYASRNGHLEVIKYLVECGADITAKNNYAVRHASKNGYLKVVKYLIDHGADITAKNNYAIRHASNNNHLKIVNYLVAVGSGHIIHQTEY